MRTRWARDSACVFSMTCARWVLTVSSLVPSSSAICLFKRPATTRFSTSVSRGVSESKRLRISVSSARSFRTVRGRARSLSGPRPADPDREPAWSRTPCAPSFIARTDMGMSPWPVMKMIGNLDFRIAQFALKIEAAQARHSHIEDETGRRIRPLREHEVPCRSECLRAKADGPDEALQFLRGSSRSSSMTNTIGSGFFHAAEPSPLGRVN